MSNRKTRDRHLAKLAARRAAERRRRRRQRITAGAVAFAVAAGGGIFAFVAFTGGKATPTPTPVASGSPSTNPTPSPSYSPTAVPKVVSTVTPSPPAVSAVACGAKVPAAASKGKPQFSGPPPIQIDPSKTYLATLQTSCGDITIKLLTKQAPITANNFVFLAKRGYFDGTYFHRLADSIDVIQGGDPTGTGKGGPGYSIPDELPQGAKYTTGVVAMANAGPNTGGSQFFIITGPQGGHLDSAPNYPIFGQVVKGLDVAQKIQAIPVQGAKPGDPNADGAPTQTVYVEKVTITVEGGTASPTPSPAASPTKSKKPKPSPSSSMTS
ncbi:MAG: peptidylprolyl isomerase [Actinomycetota bacterium]|nr:peptidylprolyl isomerase [Actinomycetota bacterium]